VLLARRADRLKQVAAKTGSEIEICDVSDADAVKETAARVLEAPSEDRSARKQRRIPSHGSFLSASPERIEQVIRTNYLGSVWVLRAFLPGLEKATPSSVVNIVSVAGTTVVPDAGPYSASKHAQLAFSRALRAELKAARNLGAHGQSRAGHDRGIPADAADQQALDALGRAQPRAIAAKIGQGDRARQERDRSPALDADRRDLDRALPGDRDPRGGQGRPGPGRRAAERRRWRVIELLYCRAAPRIPKAKALLEQVLAELGRDDEDRADRGNSDAEAERLRFPGSPTIRIDGLDIDAMGANGRPRSPAASTTFPTGGSRPFPHASNWRLHSDEHQTRY